MNHRNVGLFFALLLSPMAFGWAGDQGITYSVPEDFPKAEGEKISAALNKKDCKFIHGEFFNTFSWLRYTGDTKALNGFIGDLARCPHLTVRVRFFHGDVSHAAFDWNVYQNGMSKTAEMCIDINVDSKHLKIEELELPPVKGEPAK